MSKNELSEIRDFLRVQLRIAIDFWLRNSFDEKDGGMFPALDRKGQVFSCDKTLSSQGAFSCSFSKLCNVYGAQDKWKKVAKSSLKSFNLKEVENFDFETLSYFALANAEYYEISGKEKYLNRARYACLLIEKTVFHRSSYSKLSELASFLKLLILLKKVDPANLDEYRGLSKKCVERIISYHYNPDLKTTLEVAKTKKPYDLDTSKSRLVFIKSILEASLLLAYEASEQDDDDLKQISTKMLKQAIDDAWDSSYGGLFYKLDCASKPLLDKDSDLKVCDVHALALASCICIYKTTRDDEVFVWLKKVVSYCQANFVDHEFGGWFSYLARDGKVPRAPYKGSLQRGPEPLITSLVLSERALTKLIGDEK